MPRPDDTRADLLVLGGTGFIGSAIVREAQARGLNVIALNRATYRPGLAARWLVNANGNSRKFLAHEQPAVDFDLSVRSVMQSLQDFSVERYCFLSSIDVYDQARDPEASREDAPVERRRLTPYGLHKLMAEDLVRAYAPAWLILRMGGFVGPGLRKNSIYDLLKGHPLRVHPDSQYQYLHTGRLAEIVLDLMQDGVQQDVFNAAGAGVVSIRDVAGLLPKPPVLDEQGPRERYEVNVEKLGRRTDLPSSRATVEAFVRDVLAGRETLA